MRMYRPFAGLVLLAAMTVTVITHAADPATAVTAEAPATVAPVAPDTLIAAWDATLAAKEAAADSLIADLTAYAGTETNTPDDRAQVQYVLMMAHHSRGEVDMGAQAAEPALAYWLQKKDLKALTTATLKWGKILNKHFGEQLAEVKLYDSVAARVAAAEIPPVVELELARVSAHRGLGDQQGALSICEAALATEPAADAAIHPKTRRGYWSLSEQRASLLQNLGKHEASRKVWTDRYEAAATPDVKAESLWNLASLCESSRRTVEAINYYKQLVAEYPTSPFAARASAKIASLKRDMMREVMSDLPGLD